MEIKLKLNSSTSCRVFVVEKDFFFLAGAAQMSMTKELKIA